MQGYDVDPGESLFGCKLVEGAEHGARQVGDSPWQIEAGRRE